MGAGAALAGAVLGFGGTLATAYLSSRWQARSAHVQWRRQVPRDAYAGFLTKAMDHHNVSLQLHHLIRRDRSDRDGIRELFGHGRQLLDELDRHGAVVDVEGPSPVAWSASVVVRTQREWAAVLLGTWYTAAPHRSFREYFPPEQQQQQAIEALRAFRHVPRRALDDPDGALRQ